MGHRDMDNARSGRDATKILRAKQFLRRKCGELPTDG
jgi:hypothetical protein